MEPAVVPIEVPAECSKRTVVLTLPTPACRDTPFRGKAAARFTTRWIKHVTFVNAAEIVRRQCLTRMMLAALFQHPRP